MRLKEQIIDLDSNKIKTFFENRAEKYDERFPYNTTMYQDADKELTNKRNKIEQSKVLKYLNLDERSKVIDIACGIGRWGDAIESDILGYYGIDFSGELIKIAKARNVKDNYYFKEASVQQLKEIVDGEKWGKFNRVILGGILMYLNDKEIQGLFSTINKICDEEAIVYIREPVGIDSRLTLKDFYSSELNSEYNAVYRTKKEYLEAMKIMFNEGFVLSREEILFEEDKNLNNRKETVQCCFILERHNV